MTWFSRIASRVRGQDIDELNDEFYDRYEEEDYDEVDPESVEPPTLLGKLMERVMEYREEEIGDLRSKAYETKNKADAHEKNLALVTYERNEALQRLAKIYEILNEKQRKQLAKPPVELFHAPVLYMNVFDEKTLDYRRVEVPPPAKMETIRRKGTQDKAVTVFNADRKTRKSNLDNEREQATLRQSKRRGK
jgi:hypothetical protein